MKLQNKYVARTWYRNKQKKNSSQEYRKK